MKAHHVCVLETRGLHPVYVLVLPKTFQLVAVVGRVFVPSLPRGALHHLPYLFRELPSLPLEKRRRLLDQRPVVLLRYLSRARTRAELREVAETRAVPVPLELVAGAVPEGKEPVDEPDGLLEKLSRGEGTEIDRPVVLYSSGARKPREPVVHREAKRGERLVVLQAYVVLRLVALYEGVFQEKRLAFALRHHVVDRVDLPHQVGNLASVPSPVGAEIRGDAAPQVLGLAYVDGGAVASLHYVDARRFGKGSRKLEDVFAGRTQDPADRLISRAPCPWSREA